MRALVKERPGAGLSLLDRPLPAIGPNDVLIKVSKAGICGTDGHIWDWDAWASARVRPPLVVGHEFMGRVAAIGEAVRTLEIGDRVSAEGHLSDGTCVLCRTGQAHICKNVRVIGVDRDGCFADFISMPESNVWKLDPAIPDEWAAIFDPFGNAVHAVSAAQVSLQTVLVTGAGSIGLMSVAVAAAAGASKIIAVDPNPHKLAVAKLMGAHHALDARSPDVRPTILEQTGGAGPDVLLEMSGNPDAIQLGLDAIRHGGRAAILGIPATPIVLDLSEKIVLKGVTLLGIFGRKMFETWYQMQSLVTLGRVDLSPIVTHRFPLEQFAEAFALLHGGQAIKIVMEVDSE